MLGKYRRPLVNLARMDGKNPEISFLNKARETVPSVGIVALRGVPLRFRTRPYNSADTIC